jgi:LacI family transcriptional regulator
MARKHRIPQVGLIVETSHDYGRGLIEGVVQYVREYGPWSIQFEERGIEGPPPKWLKGWKGDGIIARTATSCLAKAVRNTGLPRVELFCNDADAVDVGCDQAAIGRMAAEHFFDRGLRHFAYFAFGESNWIRLREECFVRYLKDRHYDCHSYRPPSARRVQLPHWEDSQHERVLEWIRSLPRPLGMLCADDLHAVQVLKGCRELGISVPEQIAVLGVGNDSVLCGVANPPLSSIDLDSRRIGYEAAALLSRRMAGRSPRGKPLFIPPCRIVTRQSTDVLAIDDADLAEAIRIIRQHARRGISVPEVADKAGLSRRVMERRFRRLMGRSPKAEILRIQIEDAKLLLTQSELSIEAIARQCGIGSFKYFGQVFRRVTGCTPRAFRKTRQSTRETSEKAHM